MKTNEKGTRPLEAWVEIKDIVPTLYVAGDIKTNGEKPVVNLHEVIPQGTVKEDLILEFKPDVYDPAGNTSLTIKQFTKPLKSDHEYKSVTIRAKKGDQHLSVKVKERQK